MTRSRVIDRLQVRQYRVIRRDSVLSYLQPIYDAFSSHQYALLASLLVIFGVAVVKRYLGDKIAFLHSDAGGSLLTFLFAGASASAASLAPGGHWSLELMKTSLLAGLTAAGGYAALKNLLIEPILKPLSKKAPGWSQPVFDAIFWIFDHTSGADGASEVAKAEKAGTDAVAAKPATGVDGVVPPAEKF